MISTIDNINQWPQYKNAADVLLTAPNYFYCSSSRATMILLIKSHSQLWAQTVAEATSGSSSSM